MGIGSFILFNTVLEPDEHEAAWLLEIQDKPFGATDTSTQAIINWLNSDYSRDICEVIEKELGYMHWYALEAHDPTIASGLAFDGVTTHDQAECIMMWIRNICGERGLYLSEPIEITDQQKIKELSL